jgi:urease subunit beta
VVVENSGDRPIQVGSHYHFAETNPALRFDRAAARGMRLNIASARRCASSPASSARSNWWTIAGDRQVWGFRGDVQGAL